MEIPSGGMRYHWTDDWKFSDNLNTSYLLSLDHKSKYDFHLIMKLSGITRLNGYYISRRAGQNLVLSDGSDNFQFVDQMSFFDSHPRILAANATLLLGDDEQWLGGGGVLLEIDHLDSNSDAKETRLKFCTELGTQSENCQLISKQVSQITLFVYHLSIEI